VMICLEWWCVIDNFAYLDVMICLEWCVEEYQHLPCALNQ